MDEVRMVRMMMGQRRTSSARPFHTWSWTVPGPSTLARDDSPLPDPNTSLFNPSFLDGASNFGFHMAPAPTEPFVCRIHLTTVFSLSNDLGMSALEGVTLTMGRRPKCLSLNYTRILSWIRPSG
jgi:transcription factor SOX7/8/10/18 (SOX group E/F)